MASNYVCGQAQFDCIAFFAPGKPETKGSTKAFVVAGRARITNANPRAKSWAAVVSHAAQLAMAGQEPTRAPVRLDLVFFMPRPASHYGTGKKAATLKPGAPEVCPKRPDLDKLARCALDALTGIVYADDCQVVEISTRKVYGERVGADVAVTW